MHLSSNTESNSFINSSETQRTLEIFADVKAATHSIDPNLFKENDDDDEKQTIEVRRTFLVDIEEKEEKHDECRF